MKNIIWFALSVAPFAVALGTRRVQAADIQVADSFAGGQLPNAKRDANLAAAHAFYEFWNTGELALLDRAIAKDFVDRTLPPGRPQGPDGPAFASRHFRAAVPDLSVKVEKMIVAGPYITVHMRFTGHFTGTFGKTTGKGQAIDFIATDLLKLENARITDNWHIEDNLSLLQQMGVASLSQ